MEAAKAQNWAVEPQGKEAGAWINVFHGELCNIYFLPVRI
jgi:hypothetical protein